MPSPFVNSIFHQLLIADKVKAEILLQQAAPLALLGGLYGSKFAPQDLFLEKPIVVFDFETTGLSTKTARIIEIGAIKFLNGREVGRFSQLINPEMKLPKRIIEITGITDNMLEAQPTAQTVLPKFHHFFKGCIGVAHNAEFDVGMMFHESLRVGIMCQYTVFCTLKMARQILKIEKRDLDSLAKYFGIVFESRHRSIGDILVTAEILWKFLKMQKNLLKIEHFSPYRVLMPNKRIL